MPKLLLGQRCIPIAEHFFEQWPAAREKGLDEREARFHKRLPFRRISRKQMIDLTQEFRKSYEFGFVSGLHAIGRQAANGSS